jgi:hypothetical protein
MFLAICMNVCVIELASAVDADELMSVVVLSGKLENSAMLVPKN